MRLVFRFKDGPSRVNRTVLAVLVITATFASQLLLVSGAGAAGSSRFRMTASVTDLTLCIGQEKQIQISVSQEVGDFGYTHLHVPGEEVAADVTPSNVITVSPSKTTTGPDPGSRPTFTVTGKRSGEADIEFSHLWGEWEAFNPFVYLRSRDRAPKVVVQVTVTPCYEAYASSQEVFTKKDMGALDEPFTLAGSVDTGGVTGRSSRMYFAPVSRNDFAGVFIMIEHFEYFGIPCTVYSGGTYTVVFYGGGNKEGDLITEGSATQVCQGMVTSTQNLALRVAFRATPAPAGP